LRAGPNVRAMLKSFLKVPPFRSDPSIEGGLPQSYFAYGLPILSSLPLPELMPEPSPDVHQVRICTGAVSPELEGRKMSGGLFETSPGRFLLRLEGVARYLVADGDRIVIDAAAEADEDSVRLFLLGSVFGALLHQRGLLPLHASGIETSKGAVLFAGASGTGKSALAATFHARGYRVIADEICALDRNYVRPGIPRLLLWRDALDDLGLWSGALRQVRPNLKKYHFPLERRSRDPLPVAAIYVLKTVMERDFRLLRVVGAERFQVLVNCIFRRHFLTGMDAGTGYIDGVTTIARQIPISYVVRSVNGSVRETADLLEKDFSL